MRLAILDRGHSLGTKVLFAIIRTILRQPIPEVAKLEQVPSGLNRGDSPGAIYEGFYRH